MYLASHFSKPLLSNFPGFAINPPFFETSFLISFSDGSPTGTQEAMMLTRRTFLSVYPQEKKSTSPPSKDPSSSATTCP